MHKCTIGGKADGAPKGWALHATEAYAALLTTEARRLFLLSLQRDCRWSEAGETKPAVSFAESFLRTLNIVYHYPVYRVTFRNRALRGHEQNLTSTEKRKLFCEGNFSVELAPLNAHEAGATWLDLFPAGWGRDIMAVKTGLSLADKKKEATFETWARGPAIEPVPNPKNSAGEALCHGAVLNFVERPVEMHSAIALRRWLKSRNMTVSTARREGHVGSSAHTHPRPHPLFHHACCTHHLQTNTRDKPTPDQS